MQIFYWADLGLRSTGLKLKTFGLMCLCQSLFLLHRPNKSACCSIHRFIALESTMQMLFCFIRRSCIVTPSHTGEAELLSDDLFDCPERVRRHDPGINTITWCHGPHLRCNWFLRQIVFTNIALWRWAPSFVTVWATPPSRDLRHRPPNVGADEKFASWHFALFNHCDIKVLNRSVHAILHNRRRKCSPLRDWPDEQSDVNLILSPPIVLLCHALTRLGRARFSVPPLAGLTLSSISSFLSCHK